MRYALVGMLLLVAGVFCVPKKTTPKKPTTPKPPTVPTTKPTTPPKPPKEGKDFSVIIHILNQGDWNPAYAMVESNDFQDLREKVYDAILQLYADYDYYQDTIVLGFENSTGGINANLAVRFTKTGEGHLNRLTQAIQSGKLGELEVAPKYVSVGELDQATLYPMASCPAPCAGEQNCWPACDASCCASQEQTIMIPVAAAPQPPPPPPPPPPMCAATCPETCAPSCTPTCCFVQKRWVARKPDPAALAPRPVAG